MKSYPNKPLLKVIEILGTQKAIAQYCGVKPQIITFWLKNKVPAKRVLQIEKACYGKVTRHELRPDIYPIENEEQLNE